MRVGFEGSDLTRLNLSMERTSTARQPPHSASRYTRSATSMALPVCDAYSMMRWPFDTGSGDDGDDGGAMEWCGHERDQQSLACMFQV